MKPVVASNVMPSNKLTWSKLKRSPVWLNFLYLPTVILFFTFIIYPFLKGIQISFTNWDGFSPQWNWIGLDNFRRLFSDNNTIKVIKNTFIYGIGSTLFQNVLGLLFALMLNRNLKTAGLTRTIIYLPAMISPLIMGYIWYFFFEYRSGALNDVIKLFQGEAINFLGDFELNVWIITFVNTFQFSGVSMIIYLAGLQVISKEYYEAAQLDGASQFKQFLHITWPLLAPSVTISVVFNLIGGLKLFDVIVALTDSGPGYQSASLSSYMFKLYFGRQDAGYASAVGVLMFMCICLISITALYLLRRREIQA